MFSILSFKFGIFLLPLCHCFYVEISLADKKESKNIKLICGPPSENINIKPKHTVLWHGSQFGNEEQEKLAETLQSDALVPNITINSSKRHQCYLLAAENELDRLIPSKKRVSRDSSASIPVENEVCPPGHRIDQDRCFPCFPGSFTSGQETECYLCPKDFYMSKIAADSCWPCPEGKKTLAQGADSEESCVYFDESGHPVTAQSPPWIMIYSLIGVIIVCVWIIIIILLIRYWRNSNKEHKDEIEKIERRLGSGLRKTLLPSSSRSDDQLYETISDISDPDDHIYAEIGDYDDYEVPIKPSDPPIYLDITTSSGADIPGKKHKKSSLGDIPESADSHIYEVPIKKSSDEHLYEIPIKRGSDSHTVIPKQRSFKSDSISHIYEVPSEKSSDEHLYEIPIKRGSGSSGFDPETFSTENKLSESNEHRKTIDLDANNPKKSFSSDETWKPSSENLRQSGRKSKLSDFPKHGNIRSDERMKNIPEEEENMYDMPPEDSASDEFIYDKEGEID